MILCVGDILLDVFFLPELMAAEQGTGLLARSGGSSANTAAWLQWMGTPAAFVGCVGADTVGRVLTEELRVAGVDTRVREVPGMESGLVAVQVSDQGERTMRSSRGANAALRPDDLTSLPDGIEWVHLTGYSLLPPNTLDLLEAAACLAAERHVPLSFDPSSVSVIRALGPALPGSLRLIHDLVLLPNWDEARALAADEVRDLERYGRVAVKRGARGALALRDGGAEEVPVTPCRVVDTTGAGDAFNAGAIATLIRGGSLVEACRRGNELASRGVGRYGGRPPAAV